MFEVFRVKILLIASLPESLINFRGHLLTALQSKGLVVHIAAPGLSESSAMRHQLQALGIVVHNIPMRRTGISPAADIYSLWNLLLLMLAIRPQYVLPYTIKPVVYGSLAAWLSCVPRRYALVTGLGYAFQGEADARRGLRLLVQLLYRLALKCTHKVFFQNPDDQALFRTLGLLSSKTPSFVVNGSGVDVAAFAVTPLPAEPNFLLIARLLGDKGIREYAQAAHQIRALYPNAKFSLVGWIDENPDAITQSELNSWVHKGVINYLGRLSDVRPALADCYVYVLPSYREGTPRTVLEAMAMGRAVITTDVPGCRETVVDGDNGLLVPARSVEALVEAMERFIIDPSLAPRMGLRGRKIAEEKYDVHMVNAVMLNQMGVA